MKKRNKHIGSSLEDFLKEEGVPVALSILMRYL
jgi:hypothetical protein